MRLADKIASLRRLLTKLRTKAKLIECSQNPSESDIDKLNELHFLMYDISDRLEELNAN